MYPPLFHYRFTNSHSKWSYECTPRRVFLKVLHCLATLRQA